MKASNIGKQSWRSSGIALVVAFITLSTLGFYTVEGTVGLLLSLVLFIGSFVAARLAERGGVAAVTAVLAAATLVVYGFTSGCTLKYCAPNPYWGVEVEDASDVVGLCIDKTCSHAPLLIEPTPGEGFGGLDFVAPGQPPPKPRTRVRVSSDSGPDPTVRYFELPGGAYLERSYRLKVELHNGKVVTRKVKPSRAYCNGKRCGHRLNFSFIV
jgi:hypothetical protein